MLLKVHKRKSREVGLGDDDMESCVIDEIVVTMICTYLGMISLDYRSLESLASHGPT